ncbi:hypothetical protein Ahy_A08g040222 [Arachis hypogaea]|uniref:Protein FAR1-RELATED SEQUENCE n=1 Tax=Arachis hypogaea TaxID=3818 RepID=A0A445BYJ4_ARAHY|nr:hypothetical protein Ahy_A08g040222 [Arachis hypogaea]
MNDSSSNQLNENHLNYCSETNHVDEVGMILKTLEETGKFYKHYFKLASFSTKIRNTTRDRNKIKNQLIVCSREGRWKSKISPTLKTNPSAELNCPTRIYIHIMKDVGLWTISKVVLNHSHPRCLDQTEMLKQHMELSIKWNDFLTKYSLGGNKWFSESKEKFDAADFHTVIPYATKSIIEAQFQHFKHNSEVKCQCLLFESRGILCRHSLSVLSFNKNIKRRHTHIKSSQDEPLLELRSKRFDELVFRSHNICEFASESEELTGILHPAFDKVMADLQEYQERSKGKGLLSHEKATLSNVNDLQIPPRVKTRGRPMNRLGSHLEKKISNATNKKKKTAPNKLNLLDSGSMIQSSSSLYNAPDMNYSKDDYMSFSFY